MKDYFQYWVKLNAVRLRDPGLTVYFVEESVAGKREETSPSDCLNVSASLASINLSELTDRLVAMPNPLYLGFFREFHG